MQTQTGTTDWSAPWRPILAAVGEDLQIDTPSYGPDAVELSGIRRFVEPIGLNCVIHNSAEGARQSGFADIIAPVSSLVSFTIPPLWDPVGLNTAPWDRDDSSATSGLGIRLVPDDAQFFATAFDADYLRTVVVGDQLIRKGRILLSCQLKDTRVGRGVFAVLQSIIADSESEIIARIRITMFIFHPHVVGVAP